ncbi:MAG: hypothetical protein IJG37_08460 [Synergistaceae bacterium]|nr:hypothetical protein [Synergistaceae bacterium]MBQ7169146.1 hypothetical protein [Synergistaceae bacterium]
MATSSITHNFVIEDEAAVERFIRAIEESELELATRPERHSGRVKLVTDTQEILSLTKRWQSKLKEASDVQPR